MTSVHIGSQAEAIIKKHEALEDRAPVSADCGDCNMGAGPHRRLCLYHVAVSYLKKRKRAGVEA